MIPAIFSRMIKGSAVTVMVRSVMERLLNPEQLDAWFEQTAQDQYTRTLLFSSVFTLMLEVVCKVRTSINRAYDAHVEELPVSLASVYNKLQGIEPHTSAELVRYSAREATALIRELEAERPARLRGGRVKMLDGNCLPGSEHRLAVLRDEGAAALPGKSLVVFDPALGLVTDVFPCEDGHAQERRLLGQVLERANAQDIWVADRNFCTLAFLTGLAQQQAGFVVREHQGGFRWQAAGAMTYCGESETGSVWEQTIQVTDEQGHLHIWRRVKVKLHQATRNGDEYLSIFTNLPATQASALEVAQLYRQRWTIETVFQHVESQLNSEIRTLAYPKAALFSFCSALVAFNVMAVIQAALRCEHGEEAIDERFSSYAFAEEVSTTYRGMMIAIPDEQWRCFQTASTAQFVQYLREMAAAVRLRSFLKRKQSVKKKKDQPPRTKNKPHVSTARLLQQRKGG